ncbi:MAG: hypothetical protein M1812_002179 [Candelaria pacifica]|nr:MAG: hypothetical protein M1812_002179 [Candelaria pacifica]
MSFRIRRKLRRAVLWPITDKAPQSPAVAGPSRAGNHYTSTDRLNDEEDSVSARNTSSSSSHGAITEDVHSVEPMIFNIHRLLDGASDAPDFGHMELGPTEEGSAQKENRPLGQRIRQFVARVSSLTTPKEKHSSPMDGDGGSMPGDELFVPSFGFAEPISRLSCDSSPNLFYGRSKAWYETGRDTASENGEQEAWSPRHRSATELHSTFDNESAWGSETSSEEYRRMSTATILGRAGAMPNRSDTQSRFVEEFDAFPSSLPVASVPSDAREMEVISLNSTHDLGVESQPGMEAVEPTDMPGYEEHLAFARKAYAYLGRTHDRGNEPDIESQTEISKKNLDRILFSCLVNHSPFQMRVKGKPDERLHCKILYSQWRTKMPRIASQISTPLVPPAYSDYLVARDVHGMVLEILRLRQTVTRLRADNALLREDNERLEQQKHAMTVQARKGWLDDLGSCKLPFAEAVRGASQVDEGVDTGPGT